MSDGRCDWCGGPACRQRYDDCLALEFSDVRYGVVHHLTAHAYALQHRWYEEAFEREAAAFLLDHLDRPPSPEAIRGLTAGIDGATRVRRREPGPPLMDPIGPDVGELDTTSPETYRASVRTWAQTVARRFID